MLRPLVLFLVLLLLVLQVKLWAGQGGMREVWSISDSVAQQLAENERLRARNEALAADVADLKQGEEAVEERARSELGLIRPGETFYQVVDAPAQRP